MESPIVGVWAAVVISAVIGRIIDGSSQPEFVERDPEITREQAQEWSLEFFRSIPYFGSSYMETVHGATENMGNYGEKNRFRLDVPYGDSPQDEDENSFQGSPQTPHPYVKLENLEWMLRNIFAYPRSYMTNVTAKEVVRKYITESFRYATGAPTMLQYFKPQQFLEVYEGEPPTGANIIAIIKGTAWSTPDDRPILIGAHWDTVKFSPGTDDNGSGVAAMLEAARVLAQTCSKPKYSIIFVAFDLEETGSQGSLVFIKDYLVQTLQSIGISKETSLSTFQGAFIIDTIMNFNDTGGSQTFPREWSLVLPDVYDEVANEDYKGDFLSVMYRKEVDSELAKKFQQHWRSLEPGFSSRFKIKSFPLELTAELPRIDVLADHLNFLRSDHARFWYMNDTDVPSTLKAVLITDTGPYRSFMRQCYHSFCDGPENTIYENKLNLKFLAKATQALADTLADMSGCPASIYTKYEAGNFNFHPTQRNEGRSSGARRYDSPFHNLMRLTRWL